MKYFKELIKESGAGDWGTDKARKRLEQDTPGQGLTNIGLKNKEREERRKKGFKEDLDEANVVSTFDDNYSKGVARGMAKEFKNSGFSGTVTSPKKGQFLIKSKNGELSVKIEFKSGGTKNKPETELVLKGTTSNGGKVEKRLKLGRFTVWDSISMRRGDPSETYGEDIAMAIQDSGHILIGKLIGESTKLDEAMTPAHKKLAHDVHKLLKRDDPMALGAGLKLKANHKMLRSKYGSDWRMKAGIKENMDLDEGAVAVSTVEKEIRKNGGTKVKKSDNSISFIYRGSEKKIPVDRGFVKSDHYMKLQDMLESTELDELSTDLMKSYSKKATDDVARGNKADKRADGVVRARRLQHKRELERLYRKESEEIDEGTLAAKDMNVVNTLLDAVKEKLLKDMEQGNLTDANEIAKLVKMSIEKDYKHKGYSRLKRK